MKRTIVSIAITLALGACFALPAGAQEVLPFPPKPSGSTAGRTMQESLYRPLPPVNRLSKDAPNILIVLIDDVGPAQTDTYGGEIHTPTLSKIATEGISYNRFHTTAMCSPTRAALLTGRNHHRVASGQITELANDWDGYRGTIPKSSATVAEVLKDYGYRTAAWGKWHNTPAEHTTAAGPFAYWPTGYGFQYFYGFLAGEASQYEPMLARNTAYVDHPHTSGGHKYYHLSEDLADDATTWLRQHKALAPDKPFFMYWASGAAHGPHQVPKPWADKYKGKFDDGWDKYRERAFQRARQLGWIPQNAQLTPRPATLPSWESIPDDEKPFQRRLMEVFAGFTEHVDAQVGRIVDEIDRLGYGENTLILYIWGDNGASAEGQNGTISELLAQNGIPSTTQQQIKALDALGGLDVLGSPKTDNMYHAGWAWAGSTPYQATKLIASHFGDTRNPLAVRWPAKIKPDASPRAQFLHVNDVVPTIYDLLSLTLPRVVNGIAQDPFDGVSFTSTFNDAKASEVKHTQYFEIMGSRGVYHDGWMASAFGPRIPWIPGLPKDVLAWTPDQDTWELYKLDEDWSQANDLADKMPAALADKKDLFLIEFTKNGGLPIGGGLWVAALHPELRLAPPYTAWTFAGTITRMPEFAAPALGNTPNIVTIDADVPAHANGVLYALGGFSGGMPTPNVYVQTQATPFADVAPPLRTNTVDVLYATDRKPVPRDEGLLAYGYGRSFSLAVGSCVVAIGQDVAWDTLVQQSQQAERTQSLPVHIRAMTEQVRFPPTPLPFVLHDGQPTVAPAVQEVYEHAAEQVRQDLRQRLALTSHKVAYVYVHGFNNTFEDGVLVVAEFWHFLGRQGVPILYTWPAGSGGLRGYTHDRESGEFTIFHLKQFLRILASTPELEELHLIAHSRGTDVLTSALRELYIETRAAGHDFRTVYRIKNVVLAAADLDMEVVTQRVARTQIIDARVPTGFLGHAYFYRHPAVSADLVLVLRYQLEPGSPGRPLHKRGANFWQITPDYPGVPGTPGR